MSVSLVRKALEISSTETGLTNKKSKLSKADKLAEKKKKKLTTEATQKKNLKYLKSLDALRPQPKKVQAPVKFPVQQSKKKKNKKASEDDPNKTAFTDEDFEKFEKEYFVS